MPRLAASLPGLAFAVLMLASPIARADPGGAAATSSAQETEWYGGLGLGIDAAGLGVVVTGRSVGGGVGAALGFAGEATAIFVSPLNHAWHGRRDRVDGSAIWRAGAALVGIAAFLYVGLGVNQCRAESPLSYCRPLETAALVGPLAAVAVVDDVFRSWRAPRAEPTTAGRFTPLFVVGENRALAGVAGGF
jgi:hypothetical protein